MKKRAGKKGKSIFKEIEKKPAYILLITFLIPLFYAGKDLYEFCKDNFHLQVKLIETGNSLDREYLRLGIRNPSEDAKELTKIVLRVLDYQDDDSVQLSTFSTSSMGNIEIFVYNRGWTDLKNVYFSILPDYDWYLDLKNPERHSMFFDIMRHGEIYQIATLTVNDFTDAFKDKPQGSQIEYNGRIGTAMEYPLVDDRILYDKESNRLRFRGRGDGAKTFPINCCINSEDCSLNRKFDYEIPIAYCCDPGDYEEIHFTFSANRSCHVKYSLEVYANKKCLLKTPPKETDLEIDSHDGPPKLEESDNPLLVKW